MVRTKSSGSVLLQVSFDASPVVQQLIANSPMRFINGPDVFHQWHYQRLSDGSVTLCPARNVEWSQSQPVSQPIWRLSWDFVGGQEVLLTSANAYIAADGPPFITDQTDDVQMLYTMTSPL